MTGKTSPIHSSALKVNLERTAATVEIPEHQKPLLAVVEDHYGLSRRASELLTELNHPFVNWDFVLTALRTFSMGDFYTYNGHPEGLAAIQVILGVYRSIIASSASEEIREGAVRYLFDYLDTVTSRSADFLKRNLQSLPPLIKWLNDESSAQPDLFRKSSGYIKNLLRFYREQEGMITLPELPPFAHRVFRSCYTFWLTQDDPAGWLEEDQDTEEGRATFGGLVRPLTHAYIRSLLPGLDSLADEKNGDLGAYLALPDYGQIQNGYLLIADELERSETFRGREHLVKLHFLFSMMNVSGLHDIHGTTLREINRCLSKVFREEDRDNLHEFLRMVFALLKGGGSRSRYRSTIIDCISTIAREVFDQNSHPLVDTLTDEMIRFGFEYPEVKGSSADWQVHVNPAHIKNIRAWLHIISMKPRWTKRLLSALIINLQLKGVFVRDNDLLQKDISGLLNSDIASAYNLMKQLVRVFPVYFSEIGAEGELRDISTRMDEICYRKDKLVFFLRKQSHVESNSLLVTFVEDIFRFWADGDKEHLEQHLPPEVLDEVENKGDYFDSLHQAFRVLMALVNHDPRDFLSWDMSRIEREIAAVDSVIPRDRERAALILRMYQLLYKKYHPEHVDLLADLDAACLSEPFLVRSLRRHLKGGNHFKAISIILDLLSILKERILSPVKTPSYENIYHKRHIAAGIPSMYGTYREEKFEALGLSLRLESLCTVLFTELVTSLNLKFITKSTLTRIHECLWLYVKALDLEGIATEGLVGKMRYIASALQIKQFSIDQYIDIFQFISKAIQDIIRDYYIDAHRSNLPIIVGQMIARQGLHEGEASPRELEEATYQHAENFIRSQISSAFGLQILDNFINGIMETLSAEREKFKENKQILNLVMAYSPELTISSLYRANRKTDNQILIGSKGYYLKKLAGLGFPVPPGFILTTEVFRGYEAVVGYKYIFKDLSHRIMNEITRLEETAGRRFGDPDNPLLLSVRSGATISLPGMMHSFLNVGINEAIAEGLSRRQDFGWAAWDSYRRFLQMWGMFQGLDRNFFDEIIGSFKTRYGVLRKIEFRPGQMREIAIAYKRAMQERGIEVPDDPPEQLRQAILQVFASWYSDQARIYRHQMHLSDEWGTAVIVQAMVFGNLNDQSGSGVIFTRDPKGLSPNVTLYGDFIFGVQGDDIVSGLVETFPISEKQRIAELRESAISLEKRFPEIYGELVRLAEVLIYEQGFNHQEIEFTFENSTRKGLHILQTRDMVQMETKRLRRFKDTRTLQGSLLGTGIGVSGGALSGRAVYSEEEINLLRDENPEIPLILVRPDTVPDDVGILLKVEGLLTARGGSTSHAAVTIPQLNKVGVVGFSKLKVHENDRYSTIDGRTIRGGDYISIDGWSGSVYTGNHPVESEQSYTITI